MPNEKCQMTNVKWPYVSTAIGLLGAQEFLLSVHIPLKEKMR